MASAVRQDAVEHSVNLYGKKRTVLAYDRTVMVKTLKCPIRVVWVFRRTQWIALFTTDLTYLLPRLLNFMVRDGK